MATFLAQSLQVLYSALGALPATYLHLVAFPMSLRILARDD